MDKDVRSKVPGKCPRCGMTLVAGIPDPHEFPVRITTAPKGPEAWRRDFAHVSGGRSLDGKNGERFSDHARKTVSPVPGQRPGHAGSFSTCIPSCNRTDRTFDLDVKFPHAGLYRLLSDFYPAGATPQLITNTCSFPWPRNEDRTREAVDRVIWRRKRRKIWTSRSPRSPPNPSPRMKTLLFFRLTPNDGIEPYIGAVGHMLAWPARGPDRHDSYASVPGHRPRKAAP